MNNKSTTLFRTIGTLLLITMLCGMIPQSAHAGKNKHKEFVVVIDAGHGGKDPGALGSYSHEKDINLAVAKKLGKEIERAYHDVKVEYTRTTDVFVTIKGRMDKAKAWKADLFISLHCNSAALSNKQRSTLSGTSVYVLGNNNANDNIDLAMRENSAILLEDDYSTTYQGFDNSPEYYIFTEINQSKMMGKSNTVANSIQKSLVSHAGLVDNHVNETSRLWLLLHSTMPAVLIEMDYICNPRREKFLNSSHGQTVIAEAIAKGVGDYRASLGHKPKKNPTAKAPKKPQTDIEEIAPDVTSKETDTADGPVFKIQFLVSPSKIPAGSAKLKGLTPVDFYREGSSYKYTFGNYPSQSAANKDLKTIKAKFPDAFVIKTIGGRRVK